MKKIEILHCHGSGITPTLIGTISNSWYTHSAIRVIEDGQPFIYEAQKHGIHRITEAQWIKDYGYTYTITEHVISDVWYAKLKSKEGVTPYDYRSLLLSQPIYLLTSLFGNGIWIGSRGKSSTKEMYCSEYCAWVLEFDKWWTISPKKLHKLCMELEEKC